MLTRAIVINSLMGCALIAIGVIPGLLSGIQEGIESFGAQWSQRPFIPRHARCEESDRLSRGQKLVAAGGAVLILLSLLAFVTR